MAKKKRRRVNHNNEKATWENTSKEQPYLMPGTSAYDEYTSDLKEHNPFRPDDKWHDEREDDVEEYGEALAKKAAGAINPTTSRRKSILQQQKLGLFRNVKRRAVDMASKTEDTNDDKAAKRMLPDDLEDLIYNDGVAQDDFVPESLTDFD